MAFRPELAEFFAEAGLLEYLYPLHVDSCSHFSRQRQEMVCLWEKDVHKISF